MYSPVNGSFKLPDPETETDTDTDKCAQNPVEIYSGLLNTTQFCTSHLLSVTVFVSVSDSVNTDHKKAALTMLSVQVDKSSEV